MSCGRALPVELAELHASIMNENTHPNSASAREFDVIHIDLSLVGLVNLQLRVKLETKFCWAAIHALGGPFLARSCRVPEPPSVPDFVKG